MTIPFRDVAKHAALADVSVAVMRGVLAGEPCLSRARLRAKEYLARTRLLHLIEVPTTADVVADLAARRPTDA